MSIHVTDLGRTRQLLACAQLLTEKYNDLGLDHNRTSKETYRAWNAYLSDMIDELYAKCSPDGPLPVVFSRSFEDLFETPEQDFFVLSQSTTASAAIMEMFATAQERSINHHLELSISCSRFASTASATIGIPINQLNTQPYLFKLHWYVERLYQMSNGVSLWQVIQTVVDEPPEGLVE